MEVKNSVNAHVRWMIRRDMPEVLEIESMNFDGPWSEEEFVTELRNRNCIGRVAEHDERIVGFMVYRLHKARVHLINFAVKVSFHGKGVGRSMIEELIERSRNNRHAIVVHVRETNVDAQLFFKRMGFRAISIIRNYYDDIDDAYVMEWGRFKKPISEGA